VGKQTTLKVPISQQERLYEETEGHK